MDEFDVTITSATLFYSRVTGQQAAALEFLPHGLCFCGDGVVSKLFSHISNVHPAVGWRRAKLRSALSMVDSDGPFTDRELRSMIGRRLHVDTETMEFEGVLRLRVVDFLRYLGAVENLSYSDNEYVFMIKELIRERG